jgi:cell shape-determining protein MreC
MGQRKSRSLVLSFILLAITIIIVVASFGFRLQVSQGPLSYIFSPIQQFFSGIALFASNVVRGTSDTQQLRDLNNILQRQLVNLTNENVRLREYQSSIIQYRALLKFVTDNPTITYVGADVIGLGNPACTTDPNTKPSGIACSAVIAADFNPYQRYITINAGAKHGIQRGMPVVGGGFGLVGRVGVVNETTSQVQLIDDPNSFINVILTESRAVGVVTGNRSGGLKLQNVSQTAIVKPGDLVVSSGLGRALPPSLPIGQVEKITSTDTQLFKEATLRPAVDLNHLEIVLVITNSLPNWGAP